MRLIDADELSKRLIDSIEYLKNQHYETYASVGDSIKFVIDNQPTDYSVDKVVDELKTDSSVKLYGSGNSDNYLIPVKRAIKIVKQDDVSDVCEWTQSEDMAISPHTFSKHRIKQWGGLYTLNTCPYCRKKIKVVEQMDEDDFCYCHNDDTDEYHDCLDYMECEECPYYYADLDQESD